MRPARDQLATAEVTKVGNAYNGYSWSERMAKFKEMRLRIDAGELASPVGPCRLCGDPGSAAVEFEYHDKDYSFEYRWSEPAAYTLCRDCHLNRLHQRFSRSQAWLIFLEHVRRGGYAREMNEPLVKTELAGYRNAIRSGNPLPDLRVLRPYTHSRGNEWFAKLTLDRTTINDSRSRPRP
jgi:hypothetical protein